MGVAYHSTKADSLHDATGLQNLGCIGNASSTQFWLYLLKKLIPLPRIYMEQHERQFRALAADPVAPADI